MLVQEKTERLFDDANAHLLTDEPFQPSQDRNEKVHDCPELAVIDCVADDSRKKAEGQVDKAGEFAHVSLSRG